MAERLPVGTARNVRSPSSTLLVSPPASDDTCHSSMDRLNGHITSQEPDLNISNTSILPNGSSTTSNHSSSHSRQVTSEAVCRNGIRGKESESRSDSDWVEQDEPGVYITFTSLPGGAKDLKRVRFRYIFHFIYGSSLLFCAFSIGKCHRVCVRFNLGILVVQSA